MNVMGRGGRRKKWSEAEERTLIEKYGEMVSSGRLSKLKTREKKFKPIAYFVNSIHHLRDPLAFPWEWSWKDVSTKVQNMRHQYLLVKQKIMKPDVSDFDSTDALSHWSNFLRYKDVFGDVPLLFTSTSTHDDCFNNDDSAHAVDMVDFGHLGHSGDADFSAGDDAVLGLDFEYDRDEGDLNFNHATTSNHLNEDGDEGGFVFEHVSESRKRKKSARGFQKKAWNFLANQLAQLKEMEMQFEQREVKREQDRLTRENLVLEREKEIDKERAKRENIMKLLREQRMMEWEALEKESEERERKRREEMMIREREWEERMNKRRSEWNKRMDDMMSQHRAEMSQLQSRILDEQQNLSNQLLAIVSQYPNGLADHTGASSHYLSQMMQNLHHVNDMVHDDTRVEGDNQDDQFIVDG